MDTETQYWATESKIKTPTTIFKIEIPPLYSYIDDRVMHPQNYENKDKTSFS